MPFTELYANSFFFFFGKVVRLHIGHSSSIVHHGSNTHVHVVLVECWIQLEFSGKRYSSRRLCLGFLYLWFCSTHCGQNWRRNYVWHWIDSNGSSFPTIAVSLANKFLHFSGFQSSGRIFRGKYSFLQLGGFQACRSYTGYILVPNLIIFCYCVNSAFVQYFLSTYSFIGFHQQSERY